ncbi:hypothetical protein [Herpetosiphon llansteffanensis]|uniref:hypothetical protein n=1 Tax=Herpetosiphon llansteffanensis TaxID=2094568 RepID=UPI000D7D13E8|nr:hypothetical protein [Herpetosiphon llansteffanensis]
MPKSHPIIPSELDQMLLERQVIWGKANYAQARQRKFEELANQVKVQPVDPAFAMKPLTSANEPVAEIEAIIQNLQQYIQEISNLRKGISLKNMLIDQIREKQRNLIITGVVIAAIVIFIVLVML